MQRLLLLACAITGFFAVALGAFGAHGLKSRLADAPDVARRLEWWDTASHYHLMHAIALGVLALAVERLDPTWLRRSALATLAGIALFSGSLYVMALTGVTRWGAVTPIGGLGLLAGWVLFAVGALRARPRE